MPYSSKNMSTGEIADHYLIEGRRYSVDQGGKGKKLKEIIQKIIEQTGTPKDHWIQNNNFYTPQFLAYCEEHGILTLKVPRVPAEGWVKVAEYRSNVLKEAVFETDPMKVVLNHLEAEIRLIARQEPAYKAVEKLAESAVSQKFTSETGHVRERYMAKAVAEALQEGGVIVPAVRQVALPITEVAADEVIKKTARQVADSVLSEIANESLAGAKQVAEDVVAPKKKKGKS